MTAWPMYAARSATTVPFTTLHHNIHLSMPLKGIEFLDRDAVPRRI
jgi:hypothetical protein